MDWNNHHFHHEKTAPQKSKYIIFICFKTYVYTVVQEIVIAWLSHIQGTNRMMVLVLGSVNKPKLPKVRLKLQGKRVSILAYFLRG